MRYIKFIICFFVVVHIYISTRLIRAEQDVTPQQESSVTDNKPASETAAPLTQSFSWEFNPKAKKVETNIAAFSLQGKRLIHRLDIDDLDIIITKDNNRLIPLLRLLRVLKVSGSIKEGKLEFKSENYFTAVLDLSAKTLTVNSEHFPLEVIIGNSDVTNMDEIFVSESILKQAFGFDYIWKDEDYGYTIKVDTELTIFKEMLPKSESALSIKVKQLMETLKETEPPVYPKGSQKLISFIETALHTELYYDKYNDYSRYKLLGQPSLTIWGNCFDGNYKLKLREEINYPDTMKRKFTSTSWIDSGLWTSKKDNLLVNIGDTNFGLSDLVAPGVNLFGTSFKYLSSSGVSQQEALKSKYFKSRKATFLSTGVFEGYALLGSNVELWINNRLVDSKIVEEVSDAALGYGYYRFDSIGLLENSLNQVKFIITRPDGVKEEFHKEVIGTAQLLPYGQWAYSGGAGTHKQKTSDGNLTARGQFLGVQALYGASDWVTLGMTAATQDDFATYRNQGFNTARSPRGFYAAPEVRAKLTDRMFTKADVGVSSISDSPKPVLASKLNLEYYLERSKFQGTLFSFGPDYSNGVTSVSDKEGYSLSWLYKIFKNWQTRTGFLHIRDNLNGDLADTRQEDLTTFGLTMPSFLLRSNLKLQLTHSERMDGTTVEKSDDMYTVELNKRLNKKMDIRGSYTFGDSIEYSDDLKSGLSIPSIRSYYSLGQNYGLSYNVDPLHTINIEYWQTFSHERVELNSIYNHYDSINWRSRFNLGTDLIKNKPFVKEFLEFVLKPGTDNRLGLKTEYNTYRNEFIAGIYVNLRDLFFVDEGKFKHVKRTGIFPESGGIYGEVYLDVNWNGHKDEGEPGVPNIKILMDGYSAGESDSKGHFFIPRKEQKESVVVSFDTEELLAIYTPNQGRQTAYWKEGVFTDVNLGVCVSGTLTGKVQTLGDDGKLYVASGVRVILMKDDLQTIVKDSVTSSQGEFYIGEIAPGNYVVTLDKETICQRCYLEQEYKEVSFAAETEPKDVSDIQILLKLKKLEPVRVIKKIKPFLPDEVYWYTPLKDWWCNLVKKINSVLRKIKMKFPQTKTNRK